MCSGFQTDFMNKSSNTFNSKTWKLLPGINSADNDGKSMTSKDGHPPEVTPCSRTSIMGLNGAKCYFGGLFRVERVIADTARASTIISQAHGVCNSSGNCWSLSHECLCLRMLSWSMAVLMVTKSENLNDHCSWGNLRNLCALIWSGNLGYDDNRGENIKHQRC